MKNLILFFSFLLGNVVLAQDISFDGNSYTKNKIAYTGTYTTYYDNGSVKEVFAVKEGKLQGESSKYFENGVKSESGIYDNNLKMGFMDKI
jgi:antitoxin component YwqK of YwqJK toxin-antitoxin module